MFVVQHRYHSSAAILATVGVALSLTSCSGDAEPTGRMLPAAPVTPVTAPAAESGRPDAEALLGRLQEAPPAAESERPDAEALLGRVRKAVPEGWEVTLHWGSEKPDSGRSHSAVDWLSKDWRDWLPGQYDRQIEVRRKEAVEYWTYVGGSDPNDHSMREEFEILRFALTLGKRRDAEEVQQRLEELNSKIRELETVLEPSSYHREKDGYLRYSVPLIEDGRRALREEYVRLWKIKRWFPQWREGSLSVGFRPRVWLRGLPDDARSEYRDVKQAVLALLKRVPGLDPIPAAED